MQVKISDKITLMLTEQGFLYSNWLYIDDDVKAIIDAGFDTDGFQGISPDSIDLVLCTHHHADHIRGCGLMKNAKVMIHELEVPVIGGDSYDYTSDSFDLWDKFMPSINLDDATNELGMDSVKYHKGARAVNTDVLPLTEGQIIDFGTVKAQVVHLPGHTAGHCGFWFPEEEFLFSGDVCLTKAGPWYGERNASPIDMQHSIDKIIKMNPSQLATSHVGKIIPDCREVLTEYRSRIDKRTERVYKQLKENPCDIHTLADEKLIYRYQPTAYVVFWEKLHLLKHINLLEADGLVKRKNEIFMGI